MSKKKKIFVIFGTRPEAIKMAPLVMEMKKEDLFDVKLILTAQHREMLDQVMNLFKIKADYDLNIMTHSQSLYDITTKVLNGISGILKKEKPDLVLVHGDTTTTFAASLAAFYEKIPVGHVESGLRSFDKHNPFPEEINRLLTDVVADLYFAPTDLSKKNLIKENRNHENIFITGNTVIDALLYVAKREHKAKILDNIKLNEKFILATVHRRENWGKPLENICRAFNRITKENDIKIILPAHPNPNVKNTVQNILGNNDKIYLTQPFDYIDFVSILKECYLVLTDSGGLQEEGPALGKPVLVMRKTTERPEAIKAGTACLVGAEPDFIAQKVGILLENKSEYNKMANAVNPYGDGKASIRSAQAIKYWMGICDEAVTEYGLQAKN
ncbi:non-hydrolyzing UDP-N-acetylglucosamine 2-epimerase [bacterium]